MSFLKRLATDAFHDVEEQGIREIPGVAMLEDHFPTVTKDLRKGWAEATRPVKRKLAHEFRKDFRDLVGKHSKRVAKATTTGRSRTVKTRIEGIRKTGRTTSSRVRKHHPNVRMSLDDADDLAPPDPNMPHGHYRRPSMRNRSVIKSRSRNIRSNLTMSRPLAIRARASKYAEVKYGTEAEDLVNDSMIQMSKPAQGVESDERTGDEIRALEMSIQLQVFKAAGSLVADIDQWRYTLFQWTPNSTVLPVPADIFEDVPAGTVARQFFNLQRRPLYKVLYDVSGSLTGLAASPTLGNTCTGIQKVTVKIPKSVISYDKTAVTGANNVFALFQSWGVTANPTATMSFRFTFTDA